MLQMPTPLDKRLFHSKAVVDQYNEDVADYLAQQAAAEYNSKNQKRNKRHDKNEY